MKTVLKGFLAVCLAVGLYFFAFYKTPEQKLFEKTLASAQTGNMQAALQTGDFYARGAGVQADGARAAEWYRKAALEGSAQGAWKLAELYIGGKAVPQDLEEAFAYVQVAAQAGYAPAQKQLSRFYAEGISPSEKEGSSGFFLAPHAGESAYWLFAAARQGDDGARVALQSVRDENPALYDQVKTFAEVLDGARNGAVQERLETGRAYRTGSPIRRNDEEAARWFRLAWEENRSAAAACELAEMYQKGEGVEQNTQKAVDLWGVAAEMGNAASQYALGTFAYQSDPPKYEDAFAWFSNAAAGGHAQSQYMTGFMLMQGQGTTRSVPMSVKFFRDAAEQNHVAAQYVLGQIYWKGLGVAPDKKAGEEWLRRAADNGNEAARTLLGE